MKKQFLLWSLIIGIGGAAMKAASSKAAPMNIGKLATFSHHKFVAFKKEAQLSHDAHLRLVEKEVPSLLILKKEMCQKAQGYEEYLSFVEQRYIAPVQHHMASLIATKIIPIDGTHFVERLKLQRMLVQVLEENQNVLFDKVQLARLTAGFKEILEASCLAQDKEQAIAKSKLAAFLKDPMLDLAAQVKAERESMAAQGSRK